MSSAIFATTNPNAKQPMPVRSQARNVRSLASSSFIAMLTVPLSGCGASTFFLVSEMTYSACRDPRIDVLDSAGDKFATMGIRMGA
jgi:hypothetical protein